jgi:hypothetical protein
VVLAVQFHFVFDSCRAVCLQFLYVLCVVTAVCVFISFYLSSTAGLWA